MSEASPYEGERVCGYQPNPQAPTIVCRLPLGHKTEHRLRPPSRTRPGDQRLPDGDESIIDDQQVLIEAIEERRKLGIERYGQGHRPFNGRDTLQDLFEEHLDGLVYLTSLRRQAQATRADLIELVRKELESLWSIEAGATPVIYEAFAERIVDRLMGWVVGQHIIQEESFSE